ncbi:hypothetical protein KIN20_008365 [Parelaphostrongylus tenuis]|uniref:Uncharacterized protein n=1 Tax=Parelaphostrongylus tenuis TaxID=148309 RepID=A0AAD5M6S0_PARTN|nr:hypothetical protein KIN20_008365 [Parelaphostrongylus tenuis]
MARESFCANERISIGQNFIVNVLTRVMICSGTAMNQSAIFIISHKSNISQMALKDDKLA